MSRVRRIGIICEDVSDFDSIRAIIARITSRNNLSYKRRSKDGCSHIKSKGAKWAQELYDQGCQMLIVVHDRDRDDYDKLHGLLKSKFKETNIDTKYICIPVEEIEAWFLSDPDMITKVFNLDRKFKIVGNPELLNSPKEILRSQVRACSGGSSTYINNKHNLQLSQQASFELMAKKCSSFKQFFDFISAQNYV